MVNIVRYDAQNYLLELPEDLFIEMHRSRKINQKFIFNRQEFSMFFASMAN